MAMYLKGSNNLLDIPEEFTWTKYKEIKITLPAGNYTVSMDSFVSGGSYAPLMKFDNLETGVSDGGYSFSAKEKTILLTGGEYGIRFYSNGNYPNLEGVTSTINKLMLNHGETALPYEPYRPPQKMKPVFKSRNLIKFPNTNFFEGKVHTNNGITYTVGEDGVISIKGKIPDEATTTYSYYIFTSDDIATNPLDCGLGTYTASFEVVSGALTGGEKFEIRKRKPDGTIPQFAAIPLTNGKHTFTITDGTIQRFSIIIRKGYEIDCSIRITLVKGGKAYNEPYFPLTKFKAIPKSRNLLPYPYKFTEATTSDGLATFIANADGSISVKKNGEISVPTPVIGITDIDIKKAGKYSLLDNTEGISFFAEYYVGGKWISNKWDTIEVTEEEIEQGVNVGILICATPSLAGDIIFYPMLNYGDPLPYEPPQEIWL